MAWTDFFFFAFAFALFGLLMIGYQIPISLSRLEDCFGEHLEAGLLKGLHSCASASAFRATDTRATARKGGRAGAGGWGGWVDQTEAGAGKVCAPAVQSRTFLSRTYLRVEAVGEGWKVINTDRR